VVSDVSRVSDVQLSLYIRIPNPKVVAAMDKSGSMLESETSSEDVFLGNVKLEPRWDEQMQDEWFTLGGGTGKVRVQVVFKRDSVRPLCHSLFLFLASVEERF
jgi:serum/glucocorticoid-regulated kinase 2